MSDVAEHAGSIDKTVYLLIKLLINLLLKKPKNTIKRLPWSKNEESIIPEAQVNWVHKQEPSFRCISRLEKPVKNKIKNAYSHYAHAIFDVESCKVYLLFPNFENYALGEENHVVGQHRATTKCRGVGVPWVENVG